MKSDLIKTSSQPTAFLWLLFVASLGMTLCTGPYFWFARIGWMLLGLLIAVHIEFGLMAIFFFSVFFIPAGFLLKLPFTLKHFHIAVLITAVARALQGDLKEDLRRAYSFALPLFPIFILLALNAMNFLRLGLPVSTLKTSANLALVLSLCAYTGGILQNEMRSRGSSFFIQTAEFLIFGTSVQVLIAFTNQYAGTRFFDLNLAHNNHLGMLCAFISFYAIFSFINSSPNSVKKLFSFANLAVIFLGLVGALSRTSWFTFWIALCVYLYHAKKNPGSVPREKQSQFVHRYIILLYIFVLINLLFLDKAVYERFTTLPQLFSWEYWKITINDTQNFGFLGFYRLRDWQLALSCLAANPGFGCGLTHAVNDIHGLYFLILGATGIAGMIVFTYFIWSFCCRIFPGRNGEGEFYFLRLSIFCASLIWMMASFMETFYLQFFLWINFVLGWALGKSEEEKLKL